VSITPSGEPRREITVASLQEKKSRHEVISCLTAYDYATARLVDEAGIDLILVGDSLAMTVLGYETTLPVTVDEMLHHTRAVRRAVKFALLVADMPYASYHLSRRDAVANATRFLKEGAAEAVKIEGGEKRADLIAQVIDAEVPVIGHIGLTPQSVNLMGGYKVQGKTLGAAERLMKDAVALERAGVFALLLEGIPREVAAMITAEVSVPTIGIGAGPDCDGQILVYHDLLGMSASPAAKFVRQYADGRAMVLGAVAAFRSDVESRQFPADAESYHLSKEAQSALETIVARKRTIER
jgi:3-methyl-2-oxobutanoate hydroxymethyltransferase